jgi:hypothetical protein
VGNDSYFNKNIGFQNHWAFINEAKVFDSVAEARATMKIFKIKNAEIEKVKKK